MPTLLDPDEGESRNDDADLLGNKKPEHDDGKAADEGAGKTTPIKDWMKSLPESLQKSKSLSKFDGIDALAKSYTELESELGKRIKVPSKDASAEEWSKYYERIGRPKSPDEYAIDRGKVDDTLVKALKSAAFEAGVPSDQMGKIFGAVKSFYESSQTLRMEQYTAKMKEADAVLRKEYGPLYDSKIAGAKKAYDILFDDDLKKDIVESGMANNPRFVRVLAELGPQISGDSFLHSAGKDGDTKKDPLAWMDKKYGGQA